MQPNLIENKTMARMDYLVGKLTSLIPQPNERGIRFDKYEFILKCTDFYKEISDGDIVLLCNILHFYEMQDNEEVITKDTAFVAFYILCLYYYRKKNAQTLRSFLTKCISDDDDKYFSFKQFPMLWDLACRFCIVCDDYIGLLSCAAAGKKNMPENVATGVSYIDSVCLHMYARFCDAEILHEVVPLPEIIEKSVGDDSKKSFDFTNLLLALKYTKEAISYNERYPKYYYQLAQLIFYCYYYVNGETSPEIVYESVRGQFDTLMGEIASLPSCRKLTLLWADIVDKRSSKVMQNIDNLIAVANELAAGDIDRSVYRQFDLLCDNYFSKKVNALCMKKSRIIHAKNVDDCNRMINCSEDIPYVLVSYAHSDFKSVFCDIVELQEQGVSVVFDDMLSRMRGRDEWFKHYEKLLTDADCVLCYVSESYIKSQSVMKELQLMLDYKKSIIPVDLSGKAQISKLIVDCVKSGAEFNSDNLHLLTEVFKDASLMLVKPPIDDATHHIARLIEKLQTENPKLVSQIVAEVECHCNETYDGKSIHPLEDVYYKNQDSQVYVVVDGITRQEGYDVDGESISALFSREFCSYFGNLIVSKLSQSTISVSKVLEEAFSEAEAHMGQFIAGDEDFLEQQKRAENKALKTGCFFEPVGCVCVACVIFERKLYYACVGDCGALLIRRGQLIRLTMSQTYNAFVVDKVECNRKLLYDEYVNNKSNASGYGVVTGRTKALPFFQVVSLSLDSGDEILLASDGVFDYFDKTPVDQYCGKSATEIISAQKKVAEQKKKTLDDRVLVKISVG